jgi:hypothetical protein
MKPTFLVNFFSLVLPFHGLVVLLQILHNIQAAYPLLNAGWPICANLTFTAGGTVDVGTMLYECMENIPSSLIPPSYYDMDGTGYHPVNISIQFVLNNLINVDDLQSQMTLDYYFRCSWQDPRIYLPQIWNYLNPEAAEDGIVITPYLLNSNNALDIWTPDFYFVDSTNQEIIAEAMKLRPNGSIYWTRHFVITLAQPAMNFVSFPLDNQNFSIRFQSYAYDSKILGIQFTDPPIVYNTDPQNDNQENIAMNVLWDYDYTSSFAVNTHMPINYNPTRAFYVGYVNMKFSRASDGYIYRLGLPVTICLIVVGFSFWSTVEKRIEVTLQMLLVTAALYLVIGQVIPFVGYLTTMDIFVTTVFICLAVTIGVNFFSLLLEAKEEMRPMNLFYRQLLVTILRVIWIPVSLIIYMVFFAIQSAYMFAILGTISAIMFAYAIFQYNKIGEAFEYSIRNLRKKAEFVQKQQEVNQRRRQQQQKKSVTSEEYGVKYVKQLKLDGGEKFYLNWFKNYYLDKEKSDLKNKYLSRFSTMMKDMDEEGEEGKSYDHDFDIENEINRSPTTSKKYLIPPKSNRFVNSFTSSNNIQDNDHSSGGPKEIAMTEMKRPSKVDEETERRDSRTSNPMFRSSSAHIDSDDENEDR